MKNLNSSRTIKSEGQEHLNNLLNETGVSGVQGVYANNVSLTVSVDHDFGYKVNVTRCSSMYPPSIFGEEIFPWIQFLVNLRDNPRQLPRDIKFQDGILQIFTEGCTLNANVFMPYLNSEMFAYYIVQFQDVLTYASNFAGKEATYITFLLGHVTKSWDVMVASGEAEERDLSY